MTPSSEMNSVTTIFPIMSSFCGRPGSLLCPFTWMTNGRGRNRHEILKWRHGRGCRPTSTTGRGGLCTYPRMGGPSSSCRRRGTKRSTRPDKARITFARSATKHRISRQRSLYVVERCGLQIVKDTRSLMHPPADQRVVFIGDDLEEIALEVVAVEEGEQEFVVIHAMNMRKRFRHIFEEVRQWAK